MPPLVAILGSKWSLVLGSIAAPLAMLGFEFVNFFYFMVMATINGLGIGSEKTS